MYDVVAGRKTVKSSYYLSKSNALELFPMLQGDKLCGAIVYYDGELVTWSLLISLGIWNYCIMRIIRFHKYQLVNIGVYFHWLFIETKLCSVGYVYIDGINIDL